MDSRPRTQDAAADRWYRGGVKHRNRGLAGALVALLALALAACSGSASSVPSPVPTPSPPAPATSASGATAAPPDWPMYHGDAAHSGVSPSMPPVRGALRVTNSIKLDGAVYASPI